MTVRISGRIALGPLVATTLVVTFMFPVRSALAAVTSVVSGGALTVTGDDANDVVDVTCSDPGNVQVNGADPDTGPAPCATITSILVSGGGGNDLVRLETIGLTSAFGALASITVDGGPGGDTILGSRLDDTLTGADGIDRIDPVGGTDAIDGGPGSDELSMRVAGDLVLTTANVAGPGVGATLASVERAQVLATVDVAVTFDASAFAGSVTFETGGGDDVLIGGPERDALAGFAGNDTLIGNGGNDLLNPGAGASEVVDGGAGADLLIYRVDADVRLTDASLSGPGFAVTLTDIGIANVIGGPSPNRLSSAGFSGRATLQGRGGGDVLVDGTGDGVLDGGGGADRLSGSDGDDDLYGGGGTDVLRGGAGNDLLDGGRGNDDCDGGPGRNVIRACE